MKKTTLTKSNLSQTFVKMVDKNYLALKKQIDEQIDKIKAIKITDDNTYGTKLSMITDLNKVIGKVDARRKDISKELREQIAFINDTGNSIISDGKLTITQAKVEITKWDEIKLEAKRKEEEQARAKEREEEQRILKKAEENRLRIATLREQYDVAMDMIASAVNLKQLTVVKNIWETLNPEDETEEVMEYCFKIKKAIFDAGKAKSEAIRNEEDLLIEVEEIEEVDLDSSIQDQLKAAKKEAESSIVTNTGASYRTTWTYEVVNKADCLEDWKEINNTRVMSFISGLKSMESEQLKDGNIINGIKIIRKETAILR